MFRTNDDGILNHCFAAMQLLINNKNNKSQTFFLPFVI